MLCGALQTKGTCGFNILQLLSGAGNVHGPLYGAEARLRGATGNILNPGGPGEKNGKALYESRDLFSEAPRTIFEIISRKLSRRTYVPCRSQGMRWAKSTRLLSRPHCHPPFSALLLWPRSPLSHGHFHPPHARNTQLATQPRKPTCRTVKRPSVC